MSNQATAKGERNDLGGGGGGKAGRNNRPSAPQERRHAPPSPPADKPSQPQSQNNAPSITPANSTRPGRPVNGAGPAHGVSVPAVVPPARTHSAPPNLTMPPHQPIYFPEKGPVPPPIQTPHSKQFGSYYPPAAAFHPTPGLPYYVHAGGPMSHGLPPQFTQPSPSPVLPLTPASVPPTVPRPIPPSQPPITAPPLASRPIPTSQPPISAPPPQLIAPPAAAMKAPPTSMGVPGGGVVPPTAPSSAVLTPPSIMAGTFQRGPVYQPQAPSVVPPVAASAKKGSRAFQIIDPNTKQPIVLDSKPAPAAPAPMSAPERPVHKSSAIVIETPTPEMLAAHLHQQHGAAHAPAATPSSSAPPPSSSSSSTPSLAADRASGSGIQKADDAAAATAPAPTPPKEDVQQTQKPPSSSEPPKTDAAPPTPAQETPPPSQPQPKDEPVVAPAAPPSEAPKEEPKTTSDAGVESEAPTKQAELKAEPFPATKPAAEPEKDSDGKKSRKEILKQADRGDYKARTFDAYADNKPAAAPPEPAKPKETIATAPPSSERRSPQLSAAADDEDSWEAKDVNTLVKSIPKPDVSAAKLGKIMYDRDFLLRFKDVCTEQPPNFPPFASIIGDATTRSSGHHSERGGRSDKDERWERGKPVAPSRSGAGRSGPPPGLGAGVGRSGRGSDRGGVRESTQRRAIVKKGAKAPPVLEKVAPLVASSNRWVRPSQSTDTKAATLRKTQGLLNKLTLENFDSVSDQIISQITTLELLSGMITQIFDKALAEPHFCPMYAELCLKLSSKTPVDFSKSEPQTTADQSKKSPFTRILLTKCQEEFEKSSKPEDIPANLSAIEREELETKHRRRVLGNIKFIGELFKLGMLTEKIMHDCLGENTPVTLASGLSMKIKDLTHLPEVISLGSNYTFVAAMCSAHLLRGRRECIEMRFSDGRKVVCTPEHRIRTTEGWREARSLSKGAKVVLGIEGALYEPHEDDREHLESFNIELLPTSTTIRMATAAGVRRAHAFARLLGLLYSNAAELVANNEQDNDQKCTIRLLLSNHVDAHQAAKDIALVMGEHCEVQQPTTMCNSYSITLPSDFVGALHNHPAILLPLGEHTSAAYALPMLVTNASCPKSFVREFLGSLFGGDGDAPAPLAHSWQRVTLRMRKESESLMQVAESIASLLKEHFQIDCTLADPEENEQTLQRVLSVPHDQTVAFQERVGFRYSLLKQQRLAVAAAFYRTIDDSDNNALAPYDFLVSADAAKFFSETSDAFTDGMPSWTATFVSAAPAGVQDVYDISVPNSENFLANGLTVHNCITRLLGNVKNPVPEDIEALSKLMTTIGSRIDHAKAAKYMDAYFARITELSQNKKLPSRLRFMLKDLIDLRAQHWVARRKVEGPKAVTTQTADRDDDEPPPRSTPPTRGGRTVTIAPRGSLDKDYRGGGGDHRGGRTPAPTAARTPAPPSQRSANAFSVLGREEERYSSGGSRRDLSEMSLGPGGQAHSAIGGSGAKGWAKPAPQQQQQQLQPLPPPQSQVAPKTEPPAAAGVASPVPPPTIPAAAEPVQARVEPEMDPAMREREKERLTDEVTSILEEYLSSKEEAEAITCVKELDVAWFHPDLVCQLVITAMERKEDADREATRRLLCKLYEAKVLTMDDLERGFANVAAVLPDIVLDSPRCVEFFAAFIADALHERCISTSCLRLLAANEELVADGTAKTLLAETLLALADLCDSPEREMPGLVPNVDFCAFFRAKERSATQLMTWLKDKELWWLFPFAPAARLIDEHFEKRGNPADLESWVQDAVEAERFEEQPEGALLLLRHAVKQVLTNAFPALNTATSAANDAARIAPYSSLLKKLAGVNSQGEATIISEAKEFALRADSSVTVLSSALQMLSSNNVVKPAALKKWAADEKDRSLVRQIENEPWWSKS